MTILVFPQKKKREKKIKNESHLEQQPWLKINILIRYARNARPKNAGEVWAKKEEGKLKNSKKQLRTLDR